MISNKSNYTHKGFAKMTIVILACFALGIFFTGCKKEKDKVEKKEENKDLPKPEAKKNVYVVGYGKNSSSGSVVAKIWKNGVVTDLSDGTIDNFPQAVYVDNDSNVYVVGYESTPKALKVAKLWVNGIATYLTDKDGNGAAFSVDGSGSDVYIAGFVDSEDGKIAKLWKNGVDTKIEGNRYSTALSVFAKGADVYLAGYEWDERPEFSSTSFRSAKLWKNGIPISLIAGPYHSMACDVFVSGSDVYVLGPDGSDLKIWKNGNGSILSQSNNSIESSSIGLFVSGSDVYVTGYRDRQSKLWKNGVSTTLGEAKIRSRASSVFVSDSNVYVAGYEYDGTTNTAKLWINGISSDPFKDSKNSVATAVFVK